MRTFWTVFAAVAFVANAILHLSTFFGIDPTDVFPGFGLIILLAVPPFLAALRYLSLVVPPASDHEQSVKLHARRPIRIVGALFLYAFAGLILYFVFGTGESLSKRDGKFFAQSRHRGASRQLTEAEYERLVGLEVRCITGFGLAASGLAFFALSATRSLSSVDSTSNESEADLDEFMETVQASGEHLRPSDVAASPHETTTVVLNEDPQEVVRNFLAAVDLPAAARGDLSDAHRIEISKTRSEIYSVQGPDGRWQTYHSLNEVPPELRKTFVSRAQSGEQVTESFSFTFVGPDGHKQIFHSVEEMPPHIRAFYEKFLRDAALRPNPETD